MVFSRAHICTWALRSPLRSLASRLQSPASRRGNSGRPIVALGYGGCSGFPRARVGALCYPFQPRGLRSSDGAFRHPRRISSFPATLVRTLSWPEETDSGRGGGPRGPKGPGGLGGWRLGRADRSHPAPPPGAAIGRDRAGGPAAPRAPHLLSARVPTWQPRAVGRGAARLPGRSELDGPGPGPRTPRTAHSGTQSLAATPGAYSHPLWARGSRARWTRRCSTACWRPTAAWRWPKSFSWTAGGCPWTPRVGGGDRSGWRGLLPGVLSASQAPCSERPRHPS